MVNMTSCKACGHGDVSHGAVRADCGVNIHMPSHANADIVHRQAGEDMLCHECEDTYQNMHPQLITLDVIGLLRSVSLV